MPLNLSQKQDLVKEMATVLSDAEVVLAVLRVIPEGKRAMPAADFIRGSSLRVGSQLPVSVVPEDTRQSLG